MADLPISLDNLINYVRSLRGDGGPLDNLTDAVRVATAVSEQSDALIGYFVDQARKAGAPWSEIGASMGVSKQAVQKRFVAKADLDDFDPDSKPFSRFTDRARHVVAFARVTAAEADAGETNAQHLSVALLAEPDGIAAQLIRAAGVDQAQFTSTFGIELPEEGTRLPPAAGEVPFTMDGKTALRGALRAALRLGHNYIGTEHILLGILSDGEEAASRFEKLGLTFPAMEQAVKVELDRLTSRKGRS